MLQEKTPPPHLQLRHGASLHHLHALVPPQKGRGQSPNKAPRRAQVSAVAAPRDYKQLLPRPEGGALPQARWPAKPPQGGGADPWADELPAGLPRVGAQQARPHPRRVGPGGPRPTFPGRHHPLERLPAQIRPQALLLQAPRLQAHKAGNPPDLLLPQPLPAQIRHAPETLPVQGRPCAAGGRVLHCL
jgi:hypothetical protein